MQAYLRTSAILGAIALLVLFGSVVTDCGEVRAEPLSFDFTFTSDQTAKVAAVWDTVRFDALLTNTGTEADSYLVTLVENPPTPEDWWREFCHHCRHRKAVTSIWTSYPEAQGRGISPSRSNP